MAVQVAFTKVFVGVHGVGYSSVWFENHPLIGCLLTMGVTYLICNVVRIQLLSLNYGSFFKGVFIVGINRDRRR
jgi:hypothetical protein